MRVSPRLLAIALLLALCAMPGLGQAAEGPYCVVYPIQDLSPGTEAQDYRQTITDAVAAAAQASGFPIIAESAWKDVALAHSYDPDRILNGEQALAVARLVGAEIAVTGCFSMQEEEIFYSMQCWKVSDGTLAASVQETTSFNLAFFSSLSIACTERLFPAARKGEVPVPRVSFTSPDEGMEVVLSGETSIGTITDGRISWPIGAIAPNTKVVVEKRKKGFHTGYQTVTLRTDKDIPLTPLVKEREGSLALETSLGQLLGLGVEMRGYAEPDWSFAWLSQRLWAQPPVSLAARFVIHHDLSAGFGSYLFLPPDSLIRAGVSSGIGCIVSLLSTDGSAFFYDPYLTVGSIWVEAGLPRITIFLRAEFRYDLGSENGLLDKGWLMDDGPVVTLGVAFP